MKSVARVLCGMAVVLVLMLATTGCNTIEGVGEDLEAAGEGIQDLVDGD